MACDAERVTIQYPRIQSSFHILSWIHVHRPQPILYNRFKTSVTLKQQIRTGSSPADTEAARLYSVPSRVIPSTPSSFMSSLPSGGGGGGVDRYRCYHQCNREAAGVVEVRVHRIAFWTAEVVRRRLVWV